MRRKNPGSNRRTCLVKKERTVKKAALDAKNTLRFFIFVIPVILG